MGEAPERFAPNSAGASLQPLRGMRMHDEDAKRDKEKRLTLHRNNNKDFEQKWLAIQGFVEWMYSRKTP